MNRLIHCDFAYAVILSQQNKREGALGVIVLQMLQFGFITIDTDWKQEIQLPEDFYLPPVFENGGRYCFGFRRRIRRLRRLCGCFALYFGCY